MALANIWMLVAAVAVVLIALTIGLVVGLRRSGRTSGGDAARIAEPSACARCPPSAGHWLDGALALSGILALGATTAIVAGVVAARPMSAQTVQPVDTSRDIMLCLDVSGSMTEVDVEVLTVFDELLDSFEGERIGLTIFNSSPVQIFPSPTTSTSCASTWRA